jgi:hypothetical protein
MAWQLGIAPQQGAAQEISKGNAMWVYRSSDASTQVGAVVGYFSGAGAQPSSNSGQGILAHSTGNIGMRGGDLVAVVQSSNGVGPGLVTWHCVTNSTFNRASTSLSSAFSAGSGFDVTVSSAASS